ncbi:MAG TPA: cation-transporting P-type ATPase [Burkholderiales bacterium]|nr:cation-transporting P-type ATPase [Burkholderiales bacterium]
MAASATRAWHTLTPEAALDALDSAPLGLSPEEAAARLARFGRNALPGVKPRSAWARLLSQFDNLLIYVLLGAALIAALLREWVDAGVVLGVVLINAVIGFVQEGKAERSIAAIRGMLGLRARVVRSGARHEIPAEELVPGDVVWLESGDKVPADLRLLQVKQLRVDEAALTGESEPVDKSVAPVSAEAALGDRTCMAYAGTLVAYGQARGCVVATGLRTEIGRITALLERVEEVATPLLRQMARFSRTLTLFILGLSAIVFAVGVLGRQYRWLDMFMAVAGLAVAAIPEGLPAIMTIALAIGVQRMARRNAIIRKLPAVETLGSVSVICTDKTGTLTRNEMTVRHVLVAEAELEVSGAGYAPHGAFFRDGQQLLPESEAALIEIARVALLCNDAVVREAERGWVLEGDPTEGALYTLGLKAGLEPRAEAEARPRLDVIPFQSQHSFMATLHHDHRGHAFIYLKGAPERVLARCSTQRSGHRTTPLDNAYWQRQIEATAARGERLLALATQPARPEQHALEFADTEDGFTLLGLVGMADPPREEAIDAIARCQRAGVRVKMVTGDHAVTALAVAAQVGLGSEEVVTGAELERMSDARLGLAARTVDVFARVSPEHKLRLVRALQDSGEVVAMTGDGVNDSPALKRADVGVAMGLKGTEAAKEAADMVIADDNFASIASAVEEGRTVYENLRKAIVYILPTNGGEAAAIVVAILLGVTLPITAVQILWVNMVTEVTLSLSLAFEPGEPSLMRARPRSPGEPLLSRFLLWRVLFVSVLLFAGTMALFLWQLDRGGTQEMARTAAVNALVIGEIFYLFNSRHLLESCFSWEALTGNRISLAAVAILAALQLAFTYLAPLQDLFGTAALDAATWGWLLLFGAAVWLAVELEKALLRALRGVPSAS